MRSLSGFVCIFCLAAAALGKPVLQPPPLPQRVALADVVIVGRVTGTVDTDIETALVPGGPKIKARIAIVSVGSVLEGDKEWKTVKVAYPVPNDAVKGKIGGVRQVVNLQAGSEYLFLLHRHEDGKFLVCPIQADATLHNDNNPNADLFDKNVDLAKRCLKLLSNPVASLQAKDDSDRSLAAALLIMKYRRNPGGKTKAEAIGAEESKLILTALKSGDWGKNDPLTRTNPMTLFNQLGLDKNDGWTPPQAVAGQNYQQAFTDAARAWLDQHIETYRIRRIVPE